MFFEVLGDFFSIGFDLYNKGKSISQENGNVNSQDVTFSILFGVVISGNQWVNLLKSAERINYAQFIFQAKITNVDFLFFIFFALALLFGF